VYTSCHSHIILLLLLYSVYCGIVVVWSITRRRRRWRQRLSYNIIVFCVLCKSVEIFKYRCVLRVHYPARQSIIICAQMAAGMHNTIIIHYNIIVSYVFLLLNVTFLLLAYIIPRAVVELPKKNCRSRIFVFIGTYLPTYIRTTGFWGNIL